MNKYARKILAAIMVAGATFMISSCNAYDEIESQQAGIINIKNKFEFDADYEMNLPTRKNDIVMVAAIKDEEYFLNFKFEGYNLKTGLYGTLYEVVYKVNSSYYNYFKDKFCRNRGVNRLDVRVVSSNDIEMVQELVDKFDPYKIISHIEGQEDYINEDLTF